MRLVVNFSQLDPIIDLFDRRATDMVPDAVAEGERRADDYAAAGGRHAHDVKRRYPVTRRRSLRVRRATAAQKARMSEHVMYRDLHDFWGNW